MRGSATGAACSTGATGSGGGAAAVVAVADLTVVLRAGAVFLATVFLATVAPADDVAAERVRLGRFCVAAAFPEPAITGAAVLEPAVPGAAWAASQAARTSGLRRPRSPTSMPCSRAQVRRSAVLGVVMVPF